MESTELLKVAEKIGAQKDRVIADDDITSCAVCRHVLITGNGDWTPYNLFCTENCRGLKTRERVTAHPKVPCEIAIKQNRVLGGGSCPWFERSAWRTWMVAIFGPIVNTKFQP